VQFDRQFALREAFTEFEDSSAGLLDRTAVIEPAQFLQAVVVRLARQMVEGVAQEVDVMPTSA